MLPADERDESAEAAGREPGRRAPIGAGTARLPLPSPVLPLSQGDLSEQDAAELVSLKQQIQNDVGFHCTGYKEKCLRRRIAVRMRARGVHTYADYGQLLLADAVEYERLVDALTINVSKFFRNPEVWDVIGQEVLPALHALDVPEIRAWSAGTASGEEAYTLRILAHEYLARERPGDDRLRILGTDIDRESLQFAQRAQYTDFAMTDIDPAVRNRWFDYDGTYHLRPAARHGVRFDTLDLIRHGYPQGQHLILCRNVIIYFERSVQEDLFRRFHEALAPGGFLVLGKVEALFGAATGLFRSVANRQRVFRKP
jgi:chemotaxis protein methyltransferase CheR